MNPQRKSRRSKELEKEKRRIKLRNQTSDIWR